MVILEKFKETVLKHYFPCLIYSRDGYLESFELAQ